MDIKPNISFSDRNPPIITKRIESFDEPEKYILSKKTASAAAVFLVEVFETARCACNNDGGYYR